MSVNLDSSAREREQELPTTESNPLLGPIVLLPMLGALSIGAGLLLMYL